MKRLLVFPTLILLTVTSQDVDRITQADDSAGALHSCGVTTAGAAYCWGLNDDGELADGTDPAKGVPVLVDLVFGP
jgi:alpha-tubulin suppressor-like RCC1 family protein